MRFLLIALTCFFVWVPAFASELNVQVAVLNPKGEVYHYNCDKSVAACAFIVDVSAGKSLNVAVQVVRGQARVFVTDGKTIFKDSFTGQAYYLLSAKAVRLWRDKITIHQPRADAEALSGALVLRTPGPLVAELEIIVTDTAPSKGKGFNS